MDDPLVHCPFDMAHMCKQSRFQKHLIKCRKNHPESKLEPCPYNATEYIHPDNLIEHLKVCTKAKFLEGQKYTAMLLKENYLDAPFHIPKPSVEAEDFENQEIRVGIDDEQVLERSVSQMSVNSIASAKSYAKSYDDTMSNSKSAASVTANNRISLQLGSRSSTLRSVGRGYAMAGLISVLRQIDEMDYAKYEIRSTVSENKTKSTVSEKKTKSTISENKPEPEDEEDPDFAPLSKFGPIRHGNISLFEKQPVQDKFNFEDCSSDEELESQDNASDCSSESTIIENNQQRQATPKLSDCPNFVSDSDDDDFPKVDCSDAAITLNSASRCPSTLSQTSVSNGRESSSSRSSFLSLMAQNKMENAFIVRKMEGLDERNFLRGRRGWNHSRNRYCDQGRFNVGFQDSTNSSFNPMGFSNNKGGPQRYPQNKQSNYQNYHNQEPFSHSNRHNKNENFDQTRGKGSFNQVNSNSRGYNQIGAFGDGASFRANSAGRGNLLNHNSIGKGNYNQGDVATNKGSFNKQNSIGRGNLSNQGDYQENSVGRGNLFNQRDNQNNSVGKGNFFKQGDMRYQEKSVSRGNSLNQGNFSQMNSAGRGSFYNQNTHFQETSVGRGNILNHANSFSQENFVGRGKLNDQANSSGKSFNNQNNFSGRGSFQNHSQSFGRGGLFQVPGSNVGQRNSVGRGNILAQFSQNPQYQDQIQLNGATTNSFVDLENFKGKSNISLQAVNNDFKDLQILDYSPTKNDSRFYEKETQGSQALAGDLLVGSCVPDPIISSNLALQENISCVPKKSKPNKKKKKKKPKQTSSKAQLESNMESLEQTPAAFGVVNSAIKSNTESSKQTPSRSSTGGRTAEPISNTEGSSQTSKGPSFKILDKNMDPKKYFGGNFDEKSNSKENSSSVNLKSGETVPESVSKLDSGTNTLKKKKFVKRKGNFEIYDQFYKNLTLTPAHNQVHMNSNISEENKFYSQVPNSFSERLEKERQNASSQKAYASINCIQVSNNPVHPFSQDKQTSQSNFSSNLSFSALHSPQKPQVPRRYDRLSETASYKFVYRQLQKKKVFVNRKYKPASQIKKMPKHDTPSVPLSENKVNNITPSIGCSEVEPIQRKKNLNSKNKKTAKKVKKNTNRFQVKNCEQSGIGNETSLQYKNSNPYSVNVSQFQITNENGPNRNTSESSRPIDRSGVELKQYKNYLNFGNKKRGIAPLKTNNQQFQTHNNFQQSPMGNEMSLWSRNSYKKINSSESSSNYLPKYQTSQKKAFDSNFVPNYYPKKHSFVVPKKNPNFSQGHFSKDTKFQEPWQKPQYQKNRFASPVFTNSFSQPVAFGPCLSSHLQYVSRSPNESFDFS